MHSAWVRTLSSQDSSPTSCGFVGWAWSNWLRLCFRNWLWHPPMCFPWDLALILVYSTCGHLVFITLHQSERNSYSNILQPCYLHSEALTENSFVLFCFSILCKFPPNEHGALLYFKKIKNNLSLKQKHRQRNVSGQRGWKPYSALSEDHKFIFLGMWPHCRNYGVLWHNLFVHCAGMSLQRHLLLIGLIRDE